MVVTGALISLLIIVQRAQAYQTPTSRTVGASGSFTGNLNFPSGITVSLTMALGVRGGNRDILTGGAFDSLASSGVPAGDALIFC